MPKLKKYLKGIDGLNEGGEMTHQINMIPLIASKIIRILFTPTVPQRFRYNQERQRSILTLSLFQLVFVGTTNSSSAVFMRHMSKKFTELSLIKKTQKLHCEGLREHIT